MMPSKINPKFGLTYAEMYLDWYNNFLTVERFAEHYELLPHQAEWIIWLGRIEHHGWNENHSHTTSS